MSKPSIIVTRPAGQADELITQLNALINGAEVKHLPLIHIEPIAFQRPFNRFDKSIFISSNAVHFYFGAEVATCDLYFAVGKTTALKLQSKVEQNVQFPSEMNAEGLLALPELSDVDGERILLVKGKDGRELISQTLMSRGADLVELDVYQRRLPSLEIQNEIIQNYQEDDIWLLTSADAINHLYRILGLSNKPSHQIRVIVSSERLALIAKQKGFVIVRQSAGASDSQLVQCVKSLFNDRDEKSND